MARLKLGITWSKTEDIVFTFNKIEIARIKFIIGHRKGKQICIEAKPYIEISREPEKR